MWELNEAVREFVRNPSLSQSLPRPLPCHSVGDFSVVVSCHSQFLLGICPQGQGNTLVGLFWCVLLGAITFSKEAEHSLVSQAGNTPSGDCPPSPPSPGHV